MFQLGFEDEDQIFDIIIDNPVASAWNGDLVKNETGLFKFSSFEVNLDQRVRVINRQTYDVLSWLGDLGGLIDALYYIIYFLLSPYTSYRLKSKILRGLFRMQPHQENDDPPPPAKENDGQEHKVSSDRFKLRSFRRSITEKDQEKL